MNGVQTGLGGKVFEGGGGGTNLEIRLPNVIEPLSLPSSDPKFWAISGEDQKRPSPDFDAPF